MANQRPKHRAELGVSARRDAAPRLTTVVRFWRALDRARRAVQTQLEEALLLILFVLLRPAATLLPRRWALALADLAGLLLAASPTIGRGTRRQMRAAFGSQQPFQLSRAWLRRPFVDYVVLQRLLAGREDVSQWRVEERFVEATHALQQDPRQSLIVATGHFARQAMLAVYLSELIPRKLAAVVAGLDRRSLAPKALRLRLQLGQMLDTLRFARRGDVELIDVGPSGTTTRLLRHLEHPGAAVVIAADAPWPRDRPGNHQRAFAGRAHQTFAMGTARLSRLAQCPIVICVPILEEDERIVLEWGPPIAPSPMDDAEADARVTDMLLDEIERAIGRRPEQYVLPIGGERRWDPVAERWTAALPPEPDSGL